MMGVLQNLSNHRGIEPPCLPRISAQRFPSSGWTEERVAQLVKLNDDGLSASQIAKRLGFASRNAVIGKLNRLGVGLKSAASHRSAAELKRLAPKPEKRPRPLKAPPVKRAPAQGNGHNMRGGQTGFKPCAEPLPEIAAADDVARVKLTNLTPCMCRWPVGDPFSDAFGFCGDHAPNGPYCPGHTARSRTALKPQAPKTGNELARSLRRYL